MKRGANVANLDRARNQFKLVSDMEARLDEMKSIVKKYS